jgi:hypothetical protein
VKSDYEYGWCEKVLKKLEALKRTIIIERKENNSRKATGAEIVS